MADWPTDGEGRPLAQVSFWAAEKVPTVQYGNIEFGSSIKRLVVDTPEGRKEGLDLAALELKRKVGEEREIVYELRRKLAE